MSARKLANARFGGKFFNTHYGICNVISIKDKMNERKLHDSNIDSHLHHDDTTCKQFNGMITVTKCVLCAIGKFPGERKKS